MNIDLNLMRILYSVYQERSVSRAAERLGLSQPRVSNALASLRVLLQDPLFNRTPGGVLPTPLMRRLAPQLRRGLDAFDDALAQRFTFLPATSRRTFRVQMSDGAELIFAPQLHRMLQRDAPFVTLHSLSLPSVDVSQALANGDVDIALGRYRGNESILQRTLFDEHYVLLRDASANPLPTLSQEDLPSLDFLVVGDFPDVAQLLADFGLEGRIRLRTSSYFALPALMAGSGLAVLLPYGVARLITPLGPFEIHDICQPPRRIPLAAYCYRLGPEDPGVAWLWDRIVPTLCYSGEMV